MRRRSVRAAYDVIGVLVFVVTTFPIYWMVSTAFKPGREILSLTPYWVPAPLTLDNFKTAIAVPYFWNDVVNSLTVVTTVVVISILLAFLAAVAVARFGFRGRSAFIVMVIAVQMIPLNALVIPIYLLLDSVGQVDSLLGVIAYYMAVVLPFMIWTLRGFVHNIPVDLEEAAMVDGASRVGAFMRIVFPLVAPGLVATAIFGFIQAWNEYIIAYVLLSSSSKQTLTIWLASFTTQHGTDWGGLMAGATLTALPVVVFFVLVQRQITGGLTAGAVKRMIERCLMPGFVGTEPPDWVLRHVADGLGSVCLYGRNVESPEQLARLCEALHAENPQLVIAIDEEGGDVTRLEAATGSSYPGNLALGAVGDADLTRSVARAIGLELARAGVDLDLAPVADVNSNPANPVIGVRSFGSNPAAVARQTAAWVEGLQGAGVGACVKHFPGHGDTSVDSHLALPVAAVAPHTGALLPFQAGIAAGARAVMSAHIVVPVLDGVPGTISTAVMTSLLRGELGFDGLAVSDGLEMRAISDGVGIVEGAVRALAAGCDLLCIGGGLADEEIVVRLREAIAAAARSGHISEERLTEAANRVGTFTAWRAKQQAPQARPDREVGMRAARLAVRSSGDVRVGDEVLAIKLLAGRSIAAGAVPWGVEGPLADRGVTVSSQELAEPPRDLDGLLAEADGRSLVLTVRDLHRHRWQAEVSDAVLARRPDAVVVEMGLPACRPAGAAAYIATMGAARVCGAAAAEVMRP